MEAISCGNEMAFLTGIESREYVSGGKWTKIDGHIRIMMQPTMVLLSTAIIYTQYTHTNSHKRQSYHINNNNSSCTRAARENGQLDGRWSVLAYTHI